MTFRNITWKQLAALALCLLAALAAHKFLGLTEGMAAGVFASVIAFLMGRDPPSLSPRMQARQLNRLAANRIVRRAGGEADTLPAPRIGSDIPEDAPTVRGLPDD